MASTSRYGGPSYTPDELSDPDLPAVIIRRAELGFVDRPAEVEVPAETSKEEESSPKEDGGGSTPSGEKPQTESDKLKTPGRKRARTTGNPSSQTGQTSGAASTDGSGHETGTDSPEDDSDEDDFSDFE